LGGISLPGGAQKMKKLLFILAAIIYFPIGVIMALARNYK
jgi:hypothetical protein